MSIYATTIELRNYAMQFQQSDDVRHEVMLEPASRIIDRLCDVPDDFFAVSERVSERIFLGKGTRRLRLDPYCGNVRFVDYQDGFALPPEFIETKDRNGTHWLRATCGVWQTDAPVVVKAAWGFASVPAEIVEATIELVVLLWRTSDPAKAKVLLDANGQFVEEKSIPPRTREICTQWRRRREVAFA